MGQVLLLLLMLILFKIENGYSIKEFNLADFCNKRISMISHDIKDALLFYEQKYYITDPNGETCTAELWGWFENDIAMHFGHFNLTRTTGTYVAIRQGDSWEEGRPIEGMPEELYGTTLDQLNQVYITDWMDIFIRVGGPRPPRGVRVFELALNVFHTGSCDNWEMRCDNRRCIDKDLKCSGYNPCGDESDCKSGLSSGIIAVICVSTVSVGSGVLACIYLFVRGARKERRRFQTNESITRYYASSSLGVTGPQDEAAETDRSYRRETYNSRNNTPAASVTSNVNANQFNNNFQDNYSVLQHDNHRPPSYNAVVAEQDLSIERRGDNIPSPPDYNTALPFGDSPNTTNNAANEQATDVNNPAYLPSYSDVLQNEDAYRVTLEGDNTIVYQV